MDRAPDESIVDAGVQDGVIGGMEHGVAEPRHGEQGDKLPIGRGQPDQCKAGADQRYAEDQHRPAAEAVDQESDRHLSHTGGRAERRHHRAQRRIARAEVGFQQRKQRRQGKDAEMAVEMPGADQPQHPAAFMPVGSDRGVHDRRRRLVLRHWWLRTHQLSLPGLTRQSIPPV